MGAITTGLRELRIRTTSNDGAAVVELTGRGGMRVTITPTPGRPSRALAASIAEALSRTLIAYGTARDKILAKAYKGRKPFEPTLEQRRFTTAVNRLTTEATSPRGKVRVRWTGQTTFAVHIDQSTVIAHDALTYEINAAITAAETERGRQLWRLHGKLYGQHEKA